MDENEVFFPEVNKDERGLLNDVRIFALDLDGTVYLGETWIDGAKEFLSKIKESGRDYFFLTNNSSRNAFACVEKFKRMGYETDLSHVVTSGQATVWYLKKHFPGKRVYLLGNESLKKEFLGSGILLDDKDPETVVIGFDTTLTYDKMRFVCDKVREGLPYISTHPDDNCPTDTGMMPDMGAIMAFIKASAYRMPDVIVGKPYSTMAEYLMERVHEMPSDAALSEITFKNIAMVGDRLSTDIAFGVKNKMTTILVLSGEATLNDAKKSDTRPDLVYNSVKDLL